MLLVAARQLTPICSKGTAFAVLRQMRPKIIVLSGPISGGKSDLATRLAECYDCPVVKTSTVLADRGSRGKSGRRYFQRLGDRLDRETDGTWVRDALRRKLGPDVDRIQGPVLVDAVRIQRQVDYLRAGYGQRNVLHIHVTAPEEDLRRRYNERAARDEPTYDEVRRNRTERNIEHLAHDADVVVDTARCTRDDVFVRAACLAGLMSVSRERNVDVLIGAQYGSEGKGQVAAYLLPEYDIVVRVAGPNAGHKVSGESEDETHEFHHLPSGSHFFQGKILLGPGAVITVANLLKEIAEHDIDHRRLAVDPQAVIIESDDIEREASLEESIGSTRQGVGFATARKVLRNATVEEPDGTTSWALGPEVRLARDVRELDPYIRPTRDVLDDAYATGKRVLVEGTQGTHLSLHHGPYPNTTSRETTVSGCLADAGIPPSRVRRIILVVRTYPIRVAGNSGEFAQELEYRDVATRSGVPENEIRETEITTTTKKPRRVGEFEWSKIRESALLNGPTDVALTFADYLNSDNSAARRFDQLTSSTVLFIEEVERVTGAKVSLVSTRFHQRAIIDRRNWRND